MRAQYCCVYCLFLLWMRLERVSSNFLLLELLVFTMFFLALTLFLILHSLHYPFNISAKRTLQTSRGIGTTEERSPGNYSKPQKIFVKSAFTFEIPQESIHACSTAIWNSPYKEIKATSICRVASTCAVHNLFSIYGSKRGIWRKNWFGNCRKCKRCSIVCPPACQ